MATTYTSMANRIVDDKHFIEQYCNSHPLCKFRSAAHPELKNVIGHQLSFPDGDYVFSMNFKNIVKYIFKHEARSKNQGL